MSFVVNGQTWTPQTAATHAQTQLTELNALQESQGLPTLLASPANALWLNFLASGSIQQIYDEVLFAASQSFNVATCDDQQLLNLAPMSGTQQSPATYSTVYISVTAASAGNAVIPAGTLAPFGSINFSIAANTTVPAGTTVAIFAVADTPGPYLALAGQITSLTNAPANVQTVTNLANSTQGSDTESLTAFRARLLSGAGTINWDLNGTILAIRALQGINYANVYFNTDTINDLVLTGGYTIKPRHARIVIQGSDVTGQLANTYANRMTAPTDGAHSENWITASNQTIPIFYDTATSQDVYVNIYYDPNSPLSSGYDTLIKQIIVDLNSNVIIGQAVNSQFILMALDGFQYATITGAEVSLDNVTYHRSVSTNAISVPNFTTAKVNVLAGP